MPVHPASFGQVWAIQLFVQALRPKLLKGYLSDPANVQFVGTSDTLRGIGSDHRNRRPFK